MKPHGKQLVSIRRHGMVNRWTSRERKGGRCGCRWTSLLSSIRARRHRRCHWDFRLKDVGFQQRWNSRSCSLCKDADVRYARVSCHLWCRCIWDQSHTSIFQTATDSTFGIHIQLLALDTTGMVKLKLRGSRQSWVLILRRLRRLKAWLGILISRPRWQDQLSRVFVRILKGQFVCKSDYMKRFSLKPPSRVTVRVPTHLNRYHKKIPTCTSL